jgi:hypothetical protein
MSGPLTHSPDPQHLGTGAGTAAAQTAVPRQYADPSGIGYTDTPPAEEIPATGVSAGVPGAFTPAGATPPANLAALNSSGLKPTLDQPWTGGTYVVLGDATHAWYAQPAWTAGQAP